MSCLLNLSIKILKIVYLIKIINLYIIQLLESSKHYHIYNFNNLVVKFIEIRYLYKNGKNDLNNKNNPIIYKQNPTKVHFNIKIIRNPAK